jgi:hypothetical protein
MNAGGRVRTLFVGMSLALCGCSGRTVGAAADRVDGGGPGTSAVGSPGVATCPATPAQLVDFNRVASDLGTLGIHATQLAVDSESVYFVYDGSLLRVPIQGGSFSTLLGLTPQVDASSDPVATSTAIVFHYITGGTSNDEGIVAVPKAGGAPKTLAVSIGRVLAFAANDASVYFVDQGGLETVPTGGGKVELLSSAISSGASGLAVVGSSVIVTTSDPEGAGAVYEVPIAGGVPTMRAAQQPINSFPMACGPDVCWWTGATAPPSTGPTGPGFVARLSGSAVTTIPAPVFPWSVSFDGTDFFETVGCDLCSGTLVRIPSSGGPQVLMVSAGYAAVQGDCVYFSVALGFGLPSSDDGGIPSSGIYAVSKSYVDPTFQRDL